MGRIVTAPGAASVPIEAGLSSLSRRGPDSARSFRTPDGRVELLHARLAIVDTDSRAHQPFSVDVGRVTLAFNGEIYNYKQLRAEIDYPFATDSDTEVLAALYARFGIEGLRRLRGMYALSIVDQAERKVVLLRDSVGKKPLFWARFSDGVYFGSSVLAFVAASSHPASLESRALPAFADLGHVLPTESIVADVRPVLPGQVLQFDFDGQLVANGRCEPTSESASFAAGVDLPTAEREVARLVRLAVSRRLSNNDNPTCLLSGGVDSTLVARELASVTHANAITLGSVIPLSLDEKYARYAARRLHLSLQVVRLRVARLADEVSWALDLQDEPLGMIAFFPLSLMVREARAYGRILLTGDGGDEVFLGYGRPADWQGGAPADDAVLPAVGTPVPSWMSSWGRRTVSQGLLGHMFAKLDRATAEQGVEARCPLLDSDLIDFVRRLPPDVLFADGHPKALLKRALSDFPPWFVHRRKLGFTYRLRWAWALRGFAGLREQIRPEAQAAVEPWLPLGLRRPARDWSRRVMLEHFSDAWKLLALSAFTVRLAEASRRRSAPTVLATP